MKSSGDSFKQRTIENALASLLFGDVPDDLRPLAEAVRDHDWRTISNAALAFESPGRNNQVFLDSEIQFVAMSPRHYGVTRLAKCDVRRIMMIRRPDLRWPKDERHLWKRLGLDDLPEGRGGENEKALRKWEQRYSRGDDRRGSAPHAGPLLPARDEALV
jgi:hypothetical protein